MSATFLLVAPEAIIMEELLQLVDLRAGHRRHDGDCVHLELTWSEVVGL
jgi:hypothetical protein